MSTYSKQKQMEHIALIRSILVRKSDASLRTIQEVLERDTKLKLHLSYINKMVHKIREEKLKRFINVKIDTYLTEFADETKELKEKLWAIMNDPQSSQSDKVKAIKEIRESSKVLMEKMFDGGVFERQIGKLKTEGSLNEDEKKMMATALSYVTRRKLTKDD
jgi:Na+-transporting NADH:ubiquinone oxidoreductase subunit NqrC